MSKKSNANLYNNSAGDFIPVVCHYDENTLLTRNGELVQTIEIKGLGADNINTNLMNLRAAIRKAIAESSTNRELAFWVHTIRRKGNLDDEAKYYGFFAANLHDIWSRKNFWQDKFINRLYITIVTKPLSLKCRNATSIIRSFFAGRVKKIEANHLTKSFEKISSATENIVKMLSDYGAKKLGIYAENNKCYSEPIFLYNKIVHLNENECELPISDISSVLDSHKYAIGNNKIEVIDEKSKKFASIFSFKEYQEIPATMLNKFLHIPVEMIMTEVFYFIDKKEIATDFKDQKYILGLGGDKDLYKWKALDKLDTTKMKDRYCHQQISCMIFAEDTKTLDFHLHQASEALSNLGIMHVKEDIGMERAFWAQLPGNFSFLSRIKPAPIDNVGALASLHNYPTGNQYCPWGKALTLLRAEHGAPYFMNFHDQTEKGVTCIFGDKKSGRTTLLNFLLSEADKFYPTTLYLTDVMDSGIYIKARGGKWFQRKTNMINPLICDDTESSKEYLFMFFKIIAKHFFDPMSPAQLKELQEISNSVFELPNEKRKLSEIIAKIKDKSGMIKERLADYAKDGEHYGVFETEGEKEIELNEGDLVALNLQDFDDYAYKEKNYPKEKKYIKQFNYKLNTLRAVKAAIMLSAQNKLESISEGPKIFAVDNLNKICFLEHYADIVSFAANRTSRSDNVFVFNVNTAKLIKLVDGEIQQPWTEQLNTKIILSSNNANEGLKKVTHISNEEYQKILDFKTGYYQFLVMQDEKMVSTELSIGSLPGIVKILYAEDTEIKQYKKIVKETGDEKPEDWVESLYNEFDGAV